MTAIKRISIPGLWRLRSACQKINLSFKRFRMALSYHKDNFSLIYRWSLSGKETTNFTYDLTDINLCQLAGFVSDIAGCSIEQATAYIDELLNDKELADHVFNTTLRLSRDDADVNAHYGRRAGWYALVRACKPRVIVETGVDKGLGTCVLAAAVRRNCAEGVSGHVWATDIQPNSGWLVGAPYSTFATILRGDSIESLKKLDETIDLFINDSDHSVQYEIDEYKTIEKKLSGGALILGDNSHCTTALFDFAKRTQRSFLFFSEHPKNHWYPGGGIGVAFQRGLPRQL